MILASGSLSVAELQRATRTVPIVFAVVADPVGGGFVESLSRPGGNTTGFMLAEYSFSGKWVELLKQVAPHMTHVGVDATPTSRQALLNLLQSRLPRRHLELR